MPQNWALCSAEFRISPPTHIIPKSWVPSNGTRHGSYVTCLQEVRLIKMKKMTKNARHSFFKHLSIKHFVTFSVVQNNPQTNTFRGALTHIFDHTGQSFWLHVTVSQTQLWEIFVISGRCKEYQSDCGLPPGCETLGDKTKPLSPCQTTSLVLFTSGLATWGCFINAPPQLDSKRVYIFMLCWWPFARPGRLLTEGSEPKWREHLLQTEFHRPCGDCYSC